MHPPLPPFVVMYTHLGTCVCYTGVAPRAPMGGPADAAIPSPAMATCACHVCLGDLRQGSERGLHHSGAVMLGTVLVQGTSWGKSAGPCWRWQVQIGADLWGLQQPLAHGTRVSLWDTPGCAAPWDTRAPLLPPAACPAPVLPVPLPCPLSLSPLPGALTPIPYPCPPAPVPEPWP